MVNSFKGQKLKIQNLLFSRRTVSKILKTGFVQKLNQAKNDFFL